MRVTYENYPTAHNQNVSHRHKQFNFCILFMVQHFAGLPTKIKSSDLVFQVKTGEMAILLKVD